MNCSSKPARSALRGTAAVLLAAAALAAGAASAHPHKVEAKPGDGETQTLANGQNHAPFVNGQSCGGDPAAYGLETAHHGPDSGAAGRGDGCYQSDDTVGPPNEDVANPVIK